MRRNRLLGPATALALVAGGAAACARAEGPACTPETVAPASLEGVDPRIGALGRGIVALYNLHPEAQVEFSKPPHTIGLSLSTADGGKIAIVLQSSEVDRHGVPTPQSSPQMIRFQTEDGSQPNLEISMYARNREGQQEPPDWDTHWQRGTDSIGEGNNLPGGNLAPKCGTGSQGKRIEELIIGQAFQLLGAVTSEPPKPMPELPPPLP